ncbi:hypothetical protein [Marinobacter sp. SS21]|uniref:hypothetical protein n=1 Tax=Marinobacter sp. SS21 TaxID=2979460 RepID=UPI00232E108D|nr:hypothetical protein [Marinobacter sp. SS21]MDC0664121.1 hypothetical protein [Marinobacter sp. SS21]
MLNGLLERLHPMPQNDLTLRAPIAQARETELRTVLAEINQDPAGNAILPFAKHDNLHFARLLILEGPDHPDTYDSSLVLTANVDGPVTVFLRQLVARHAGGLDRLYAACPDYPGPRRRSPGTRLAFLQRQRIPSQAYYINTIGRTAAQIRQEDRLQQALQTFLNGLTAADVDSARRLRQRVVEFVANEPELAWALTARAQPGLWWRSWEKARFAALVALGLLIVAWGWPVLVTALLALRWRESQDPELHTRPALSRLNQLRATEDFAAHNPFAAVGYVKPGWLRQLTARALLASAQVALRHVFNRGNLAGVPLLGLDGVDTIHFARWTILDNGRRLLFTSNYDGSLESYMVDFVDKVAWGLNLIFSNGVGYPRTRWLVHEGARHEQRFKDYLGLHQLINQAWYSPYPHLTALNIANNEAIRDGLRGSMSEAEVQAWLARL